jgi:hypothetical protein
MTTSALLVLDYPGRRTEARVGDLALETHGFAVHHLLTAPFVRACRAAGYAEELLSRDPLPATPAAVLAYCMAAPIAQEVAARVSRGGPPVPLVLLDGEPAGAADLEDQYVTSIRQYTAQLGGRAAPEHAAGTVNAGVLTRDPEQTVTRMRHGLVSLGTAALGGDAEAAEAAEDLAEFYLDWLVHLVAASNATWPSWGGSVLQVVSRDHRYPQAWPGASATRTVHIDVPRPDLLRSPEVVPAIKRFLDSPDRF